jgi:cellulose synthase/poly-beta-1,6-N-acetylglucosamine synthase-like glycosyltransferase
MTTLILSLANISLIAYFAALSILYAVFCVLGYAAVRRALIEESLGEPEHFYRHELVPYISLLVPAYNESTTIAASLRSLCLVRYPNLEIIVVNDGSTDDTLEVLIREMELVRIAPPPSGDLVTRPLRGYYRSRLFPQLIVMDKVNGGKADSLNVALNHCTNPLFCAVDADSLLEANSLLRISQAFVADPLCIAAGGVIRVVNECEVELGRVTSVRLSGSWLVRVQVVEYLRAFLFGRMGLTLLQSLMIVSGAFGVFRTDAVLWAGGYEAGTVGEDMELVVRLHRKYRESKRAYTMTFLPTPICWTEVPDRISILSRQRARWQRGLLDTLWRHSGMFLNPEYGLVGIIGFPYFLMFELLGPVVEIVGYIYVTVALAFGLVNIPFAAWFMVVALVLGSFNSALAVLLECLTYHTYERVSDVVRLLFAAVFENFGFRQLTVFWRLKGMAQFIIGTRSWGTMERRGFGSAQKAG